MDLLNGNEGESTKSLTSTLKGMLKINGASGEGSQTLEDEGSPKADDFEKAKRMSVDEEPSASGNGGGVQQIDLSQALDGECIPIVSEEVTIFTSPNSDLNSKSTGSDKVRIKPITKFEWEHKYYSGTLVSVTDNYTAYAIKSKSFAVRVISRKNSSDRLLLRGFTAPVCDVAFAHPTSNLISAVDEEGNFLIWQLSSNGDSTTATKKLHVKSSNSESLYHRLVWLTFMHCDIDGTDVEDLVQLDEEGSEPDPAGHKRLLAATHGSIVEVWDINAAFEIAENDEDDTGREKLSEVFMTIKGHDDVVTDCELSPEGSVIAVASHDGYVKFWQVDVDAQQEPSCLHRWKPHGDRPVSLVTFCDDRTQSQLVLYWRFMLTGCCQNRELKIWCTVSWSCLQTISFEPPPGSTLLPALKCTLHAAADYLVVSDVNRKVVYVLRCLTDLEQGKASLSSISQYLLTAPLLSFAIVDAQKCKFKALVAMDEEADDRDDQEDVAAESDEEKEGDGGEDSAKAGDATKKLNGVLIKLASINTKSLETLDIRFIPHTPADETLSLSTYNTISDELNIVSVDESLSLVSPLLDNGQSQDEMDDAQQEEEEEGESSTNKTALTANEGDQSTILAVNEDETEQPEKDEAPKSNVQDSSAPPSVMDLVGGVNDDPPVAHSSPSGGRQYNLADDPLNRGQGEGEAAMSPPKSDTHPVLLTPDAFTSSLRKPDDLNAAESSFTHITPFSVDHSSLFTSERDTSLQESTRPKSPVLPPSITPPPGFPPVSGTSGIYQPETEDMRPSPPLVQPSSALSSMDLAGPTYSIFQSIRHNEPGPFGDTQSAGYMTKDKSPDLISSASSTENFVRGAAGGGGDALFLTGKTKTQKEVDDETQNLNTSKRSDHVPTNSSAPWPKAPDVTMSRPVIKKLTPSANREEFLRTNDLTQAAQSNLRPDSVLHADITADDQHTLTSGANVGADLLAAIRNLQKQQEELMKTHQKEISKKTGQVTKTVEATLKKFEQQQNEKLDRALKNMAESQRKFQAESKAYSATANEQTSAKIDRTVKQEVKNTVLPGLGKALDPLKDQLHNTLAQKLTATDVLLRESLGKLVRSKETVDAIGGSAARAIQSQVHSAYRDAFTQIVVPAMEKSCNTMFQQLSVTFQRGIDDAVAKLEKQLQSRVKTEVDRLQLTEKQTREATTELRDAATHLHSKINSTIQQEVQKLVRTEMERVQDGVVEEVSKTFQRQQEAALKEQKAILTECVHTALAELPSHQTHHRTKLPGEKSSHPGTPGRSPSSIRPTFEQQQQTILTLLHQGNINAAFQRALTASDLALVMYVCEMVDPAVVFGTTPCPLHQPIILSLIQQLSCDLGRNTVTKLKYLQEAVMNLDRSHQVTQEHMHTVLDALVKNLDGHVSTLTSQPMDTSNTTIIKQMKMLSMAAKSLIQ